MKPRDTRHTCDTEREALKMLHDTSGLSWRKIAQMPKYRGIPAGSLCSFATGKKDLANEYKARLGIPFETLAPACSACGQVHAIDKACQKVVTVRKRKTFKTWTDLFSLSSKEVSWLLENRVEMK